MAAVIEVKYFNTFLLKKIFGSPAETPIWGGSFGIPASVGGWPASNIVPNKTKEWVIEEARIQGGYDNSSVDFGVKAYIVEDDTVATIRSSSLIYSGVFNSRTGINNTNQFSVGEEITKSLDPSYGSIQKIYAEDTNLIIFQENKVSRALIDKDAIYSAEGGGNVTSSNVVIGQVQAYAGNYGISKDPQSFAVYGYRKYFTDRYRNAVLRLSQDGITEVSEYGMTDFFRDEFANIDSTYYGTGKVIGGWDVHNKQYVLSLQRSSSNPDTNYNTLAYSEQSGGFPSFFTFKPSQVVSLKNKMFSLNNGNLWLHYNEANNTRCNFYGTQYGSKIRFVFNSNPSYNKIFNTINYEGANGWQVDSFVSDFTGPDALGITYTSNQDTTGVLNTFSLGSISPIASTIGTVTLVSLYTPSVTTLVYTATITTSVSNGFSVFLVGDIISGTNGVGTFGSGPMTITGINSTTSIKVSSPNAFTAGSVTITSRSNLAPSVFSYVVGAYDGYNHVYPQTLYPPIYRAGFDRKENKYMANLINKSLPNQAEISYGQDISGIKGYFAVVDMSLDFSTDLGGPKELFSVSTNYEYSTY